MDMPVVETKDCILVHAKAYHDYITELDFEAASQGEASRKHRESGGMITPAIANMMFAGRKRCRGDQRASLKP